MFFIIALLILLLMSFYVVTSLLGRDKLFPYAMLVFGLMVMAFIARISISVVDYNSLLKAFAWVGYTVIGVMSILFCVAILKDTLSFFEARWSRESVSPDRRLFFSKSAGAAMAFATLPVSGYGVHSALSEPEIKRVVIEKRNLPSALEGFKIVQLTDIHLGPTIGEDVLRDLVGRVNRIDPDIVLITGDLVDGAAGIIKSYVRPLADLETEVFFVSGNHEYYSGWKEWGKVLKDLGVIVLDNSSHVLESCNGRVQIAGVPDTSSGNFGFEAPNIEKAKGHGNYDFSILMSHRPEIADDVAKFGFDLQVSGHTHGGQYFPWNVAIHLFHKYVKGLYEIKDMKLYVSQGTAYWGPPMRIGTEAEITEFILTSRKG